MTLTDSLRLGTGRDRTSIEVRLRARHDALDRHDELASWEHGTWIDGRLHRREVEDEQ